VLIALVGATSLLTFQPQATLSYQWSDASVSLLLFGLLVVGGVSSALAGVIIGWLGPLRTIRAGAAMSTLGFLILGAMPAHPAVGAVGGIVLASSAFGVPAVVAVLTKLVDSEHQGRLQTAVSSLGGLAAVIGTIITTGAFVLSTLGGVGVGPIVSAPADGTVPAAAFVAPAMLLAAASVGGAACLCDNCVVTRLDFKQRLADDEQASAHAEPSTGGSPARPDATVDVALAPSP
jgi:MFS family permease